MTSFGLGLPQLAGPAAGRPADPGTVAARAETLGFETVWVSELATAPVLDPLAVLALAAGQTKRIRLGVAVLLTPLRIPLQLARELATIDVLSGGRLTVGLGYGSKPAIYPRYGLSADGRLRRYLQAVELIKELWSKDVVDHDSPWWQLNGPANVPKPVQQPHPPLWFGARSEPALRRAVRRGSGWIASGSITSAEFERSLATVQHELHACGRDPAGFTIAKRVYLAVTGDPPAAAESMRAWFAASYGNPALADQVAVIGDAPYCAERLRGLIDAGVGHLLINPVFDELEQMQAVAEAVMPAALAG